MLTHDVENVVKRPKAKKRSSQRISFGGGDAEDESSDAAVVTPKKTSLSRIAIEKNAEKRARSPLVHGPSRLREDLEDERPSYSKDYIAELRNSTPSIPQDIIRAQDEGDKPQALDIAAKFGPSATLIDSPSAIPSEAEIQEKKARRARLAKEQKALEDDDEAPWASDDNGDGFRTNRNEISLRPKEKYAETRLVHEDEDIAEGFEDYVEDGKISLGRKAERQAAKQRRAQMAELINDAERDSDDDETDDSEAERNAAYEAAQTKAGTYSSKIETIEDGAKTPPKITPLPGLSEVIEKLRIEVQAKEQRRMVVKQKIEELKDEKIRIAERQRFLQDQLQKKGEEYEKLRQDAGMAALPPSMEGGRLIVDRGLDSIGTTPIGGTPVPPRADDEMEDAV